MAALSLYPVAVSAVLLVVCLALSGCGSRPPDPAPAPTPPPTPAVPTAQAAFENYKQAWLAKDAEAAISAQDLCCDHEMYSNDRVDGVDFGAASLRRVGAEDSRARFFNGLFGQLSTEITVELEILDNHPDDDRLKFATFLWSSGGLFGAEVMAIYNRNNETDMPADDYWAIAWHAIFVDTSPTPGEPKQIQCTCPDCPPRTDGVQKWENAVCARDFPGLTEEYEAEAKLRVRNELNASLWELIDVSQVQGWYTSTGFLDDYPPPSLRSNEENDVLGFGFDRVAFSAGPMEDNNPAFPRRHFTLIWYDGQSADGGATITRKIAYQSVVTWFWADSSRVQVV